MLSRRAMLGGLAAGAVVGGTGVGLVGVDRVLHTSGLRGSPDHHVPPSGWKVWEHTLDSVAMGRKVSWAIAGAPHDPVGMVVCLHGRGNNHRYTFDTVPLHDVSASVGAPLVIASVDGGDHSYWHPRRDGTDAMSMVLDEFIPAVDGIVGRSLPRAVLGWSMGGYGALLVAERSPSTFVAVVASSPALWFEPQESTSGAFDDAADFQRFNVFTDIERLDGLAVHVDCGTSDGFVHRARVFAQKLQSPNLGEFSAGYHDASYWRSVAPRQIESIAAAFAS